MHDADVQAVAAAPLDPKLGDAALRLLECLELPGKAAVLGTQLVREVTYRALCGAHGDGLRALASVYGKLAVVRRVLDHMHDRPAVPIDLARLADDATMSPSAFHQHFPAVASTSPLQYLKSVRLHRARLLMAWDGLNAGEAPAIRARHSSAESSGDSSAGPAAGDGGRAADDRRSADVTAGSPPVDSSSRSPTREVASRQLAPRGRRFREGLRQAAAGRGDTAVGGHQPVVRATRPVVTASGEYQP